MCKAGQSANSKIYQRGNLTDTRNKSIRLSYNKQKHNILIKINQACQISQNCLEPTATMQLNLNYNSKHTTINKTVDGSLERTTNQVISQDYPQSYRYELSYLGMRKWESVVQVRGVHGHETQDRLNTEHSTDKTGSGSGSTQQHTGKVLPLTSPPSTVHRSRQHFPTNSISNIPNLHTQ